MKTIKQGRVAFDDEIVLPRSWNERQRKALKLSVKARYGRKQFAQRMLEYCVILLVYGRTKSASDKTM